MRLVISYFVEKPLLLFLLVGFILFVAKGRVVETVGAEKQTIVITQERLDQLSALHKKVWQQEPTAEERKALIENFLREEIFYREAIKLGLDRDDVIVRRRMKQKIEFMLSDLVALREPTEEELSAFFSEHIDDYRKGDTFSFNQVYLGNSKTNAQNFLNSLSSGVQPENLNGSSVLAVSWADKNKSQVSASFGLDFYETLGNLPMGRWQGPVRSSYGYHLVNIHDITASQEPTLDRVKHLVKIDWLQYQRDMEKDHYYQQLRNQYHIVQPVVK